MKPGRQLTIHLTEEEVEQSESWIIELQELYNEAADRDREKINFPLKDSNLRPSDFTI